MELSPRHNINLFHILMVAPFLGYIGYTGYNKGNIDPKIFQALIVIAIFIELYHGYRFTQQ